MLIKKSLFNKLNFLKIQRNQINILNFNTVYSFLKNKKCTFFSSLIFSQIYLKKKWSLSCNYQIKATAPDSTILVSNLQNLLMYFYSTSHSFNININYLKNRYKKYTLLRSPFVHKKSREQLGVNFVKSKLRVSVKTVNIFHTYYLDNLILKKLKQLISIRTNLIKIIKQN